MSRFHDLRTECCEANRRLPKLGLVDLTFGNVSVADRAAGVFAIKPSGVDYDALRPDDIIVIDFDGHTVEGTLRSSSDTPTHRCLIREFTGCEAVVHTHSRHAVAFAQAGRPIPCLGTTHADYFRGDVPVTRPMTAEEINGDYEWETGRVIVERFQSLNPAEIPSVLVHSHGPFSWGPSAAKAVETAQALEIIAQMALHALALRPEISPLPETLLTKHFCRKHGDAAYYGQKNAKSP